MEFIQSPVYKCTGSGDMRVSFSLQPRSNVKHLSASARQMTVHTSASVLLRFFALVNLSSYVSLFFVC